MILITNDFHPDVTTNARLLNDVVTEYSNNYGEIEILCSRPRNKISHKFHSKNIIIKRFWSPNLKKSSVSGRLLNSLFVCVGILMFLIFKKRSLILVDTTSPFQGPVVWLASKFRHHKYIYLETEFYPDAAIALGFIKEKSIIHKLWEISNKKVYGSASKVIVIGERLKNNVSRYFNDGVEDSKIVVIHNWADTEKIKPIESEKIYFRKNL